MTLGRRLTIALVTMASLSALLAVVAQDRALARDLRAAAAVRLEKSARAGEHVVAEYLDALGDRYQAIARTPQLRATLEIEDERTLTFFASELARQHGASAITLHDPRGRTLASAGDPELLGLAPERAGQVLRVGGKDGSLYAVTRVDLETRGQSLGSLVALERIDASRLASWSELCGAELVVASVDRRTTSRGDLLERVVVPLDSGALIVRSGLEAEREAVRHARVELLRAGSVALAISILGCVALARSLVRPIREIQEAIDRIRRGELTRPLRSDRDDEIGDVARGIDRMTIDLIASRAELDLRIAELDRSESHLTNAQRLARLGSFEIDLQSGELTGSREFFVLMGGDPAGRDGDVKQDPGVLLESIHESDRQATRETIEDSIRTGLSARIDHRVVIGSGERVMHTQVHAIRDENNRTIRLEGTTQDVTERRRAEKQIRFLAHHDSLTGLGNRLEFKERLEIAIAQARRRGTGIGIFFLDLDHFKRINDTLGHSLGDDLLKSVADRIVACMRVEDEIARGNGESSEELSISRLGGDEFTLMVANLKDPNALAPIAQRMLDVLSQPFALGGQEIVISTSIGIATWPHDGIDVDTLLRNADSAMYHAKSNGRNNYKYYEESMNAAARHRLEIETRLRRAIENGTVGLHYQPRLELKSGCVVGFEGLARWTDDVLGFVSPGDFIPIAEQTGLIVALGRHVIRTACRQVAEWERGPKGFDGRVSVNVSTRQFKLTDVAREIAEALAESRVNPLRLEIEITESVILHDEERVIDTLHAIREMGVKIALDDFGTGYSSLSYLRRLPIDVLKIDMAFVRGIGRSREDAALARAIIAMAAALDLSVVAEGVETAAQRDLLREWGCTEMQGFLASPALPADEAVAWIGR